MCGRKTLTKGKQRILDELSVDEWEENFEWIPSYNIAPTQTTPILTFENHYRVSPMRWGLIPNWAKDPKIGARMINARAETLKEKPSFRNLLKQNRCVVISDGYYEWQRKNGLKIPYYLHFPDSSIMPMAGLWTRWRSPDGTLLLSYTVITTTPSDSLQHLHNRMPVILSRESMQPWLDTAQISENTALELLEPYSGELDFYQVSPFVNSTANNSPECIKHLHP